MAKNIAAPPPILWQRSPWTATGLSRVALLGMLGAILPLGSETQDSHADPSRGLTAVLLNRQHALRDARVAALKPARVDALQDDQGHIAIVDSGDGVFMEPNPFDLDLRILRFTPANAMAGEYTFAAGEFSFDDEAAGMGDNLGLRDDDTRNVALPFPFPFYGQVYDSVFVNSDGNLTFGSPDAGISARDLARTVSGPPRIAPWFSDLDPTQPGASVTVFNTEERTVVSWNSVPEFDFFGEGLRLTFQVVLLPSGVVEFSYRDISATEGIVAIAPGMMPENTSMADLSEGSASAVPSAIVEAFTAELVLDIAVLSHKFYQNHDDAYDFIVLFHNFDLGLDLPFAFHLPVRNAVRGIGLDFLGEIDFGATFGSDRRLQCFLFMGPLEQYPDEPRSTLPFAAGLGLNTTLSILSHEVGHRFLAYPFFADPQTDSLSSSILGRDLAHWSFFFNSEASVLEGNRIEDRGEGASPRFETTAVFEGFSPLDQYLMGLIPASDVPPTFVVENPDIEFEPDRQPQPGTFFNGERKDLTVDMIIESEGQRRPDHTLSQREFHLAFLLLVEEGREIPAEDIEKVDRMRTTWEPHFADRLSNRARATTTLARSLDLSVWPNSGVLQGQSMRGTVRVAQQATAPLTVNLTTNGDSISFPSSVTIPEGGREAEFTITGAQAGITALTATPDDPAFQTTQGLVNVLADASGLIIAREIFDVIELLSTWRAGGEVPYDLRFRVRDENLVPYPSLPVKVTLSGDSSVSPANPVTASDGSVTLRWRLSSTPGDNELTVEIDGVSGPENFATLVGAPQPPRRRDPRVVLFPPP